MNISKSKNSIIVLLVLAFLISLPVVTYSSVTFEITGGGTLNSNNSVEDYDSAEEVWEDIFLRYRNFIVGVSGIGTITMIGAFIVNFIKLGASAGNPQERTQAIKALWITGLATVGLGSVTIIAGFFYSALL